jgi:hypothetical protein
MRIIPEVAVMEARQDNSLVPGLRRWWGILDHLGISNFTDRVVSLTCVLSLRERKILQFRNPLFAIDSRLHAFTCLLQSRHVAFQDAIGIF